MENRNDNTEKKEKETLNKESEGQHTAPGGDKQVHVSNKDLKHDPMYVEEDVKEIRNL